MRVRVNHRQHLPNTPYLNRMNQLNSLTRLMEVGGRLVIEIPCASPFDILPRARIAIVVSLKRTLTKKRVERNRREGRVSCRDASRSRV